MFQFNSLVSLAGFLLIVIVLAVIFWRQLGFISQSLFSIFVANPTFTVAFLTALISLLLGSFFNPFGWPLTCLALFITFTKFYEWTDDRFLDDKIGGWVTSQKYTFVQIIPNSQSEATVGEMEKFLVALSSVYGNRSQKDFRTTGKFFDEFIFEVHSDGGKVAMYVRMNKSSSLPVFMTAAQTHFPKVQFVEVANPCQSWPENWQEMNKKYQHLIGAELSFPGSDLYPTKSMSDLQRENTDNLPLKDPFLILVNSLEQVDPADYIVLQFVCRPFDHNKVVGKKWQNTIANLKKELANNAEVARGKGGLIQPYTLQEENLINACEAKMTSVNLHVKARFVFFGAKVSSKRYISSLMGYLKLFYTDRQAIVPKEKTWDDSDNATWGPFWDKLYWEPEQEKRRREMYLALIKRSGGRGGSKSFWDVRSLAAILHIPNANFGRAILKGSELLQTAAVISDVDYNKKMVFIENNYSQSQPVDSNLLLNSESSNSNIPNLNSQSNFSQNPNSNPVSNPASNSTFFDQKETDSIPNSISSQGGSVLKSNHNHFDQSTQANYSTYSQNFQSLNSTQNSINSKNVPNNYQNSALINLEKNLENKLANQAINQQTSNNLDQKFQNNSFPSNNLQNNLTENASNNPKQPNLPPNNLSNNFQEINLYQKYLEESPDFEIPNQ